MPSTLHEALVSLFRDSPRLALMLAARARKIALPEDLNVQVTSAEFADIEPPEYRADVVLRLCEERKSEKKRGKKEGRDRPTGARDEERARASAGGSTREVFIVEVQLDSDTSKHFSWPQYVTAARSRFRSRATLVVVAMDERVARWCRQPIELDLAGSVFRCVVIGPRDIPVITDEEEAVQWPELAVLSVLAHGHDPGSERIGLAAYAACARLDTQQGRLYTDLIEFSLSEVARFALEALMDKQSYTYQSDFARKHFASGLEQGYRALLREQIQQRFGELPDDASARLDKADANTLSVWGRRVLTAARLADVFAPA